jgi:uncharacterized oxidoreductase
MDFSRQNIVITGGGTGIGLELTRILHARGAQVTICGRRMGPMEAARTEMPGIEAYAFDMTDPSQQEAMFAAAEAHGPVTMLINNAGRTTLTQDYPFSGANDEEIQAIFDINCVVPMQLTRRMVERGAKGGLVVQIGSIAAIAPLENQAIYAGSKAALRHATDSLRDLAGKQRIDLLHVDAPGADTPMTADMAMPKMSAADLAQKIVAGIAKRKTFIKPHFDNVLADLGMRFAPALVRKITNARYRRLT